MLRPYLDVLRLPGTARFSLAGLVGRLQLSMAGLGTVMLLSVVRDSYAVAGIVSACYALSSAALGPQLSRLIDRHGQARIAYWQLAVHVPAILGLIAVAVWTRLDWPLYALAVVAGSSMPGIGSMVRSRWSALLTGTPRLRPAYAWESLMDEIVFIVGPPLAVLVASQLFPAAALLLGTALLSVGTVAFLAQRRTEPVPSRVPAGHTGRPALFLPGVAGIAAAFVLIGGVFGSFEVVTVAFATQAGHRGTAGLLLAGYAVGSLLAGFVFGAVHLRAGYRSQFLVTISIFAVVLLPLPFLSSVWTVGAGLCLAGFACSPCLISGLSLLESLVPSERLTESISWTGSGLALGIALATSLAGRIIDTAGASTAYWVTTGCAVGAALVAWATNRSFSARGMTTDTPVGLDASALDGVAPPLVPAFVEPGAPRTR